MLINQQYTIYKNLLSTYGIGKKKANDICEHLGASRQTKLINLTSNKKDTLNAILANLKKTAPGIELELKIYNAQNIKRLIAINCYRRKKT